MKVDMAHEIKHRAKGRMTVSPHAGKCSGLVQVYIIDLLLLLWIFWIYRQRHEVILYKVGTARAKKGFQSRIPRNALVVVIYISMAALQLYRVQFLDIYFKKMRTNELVKATAIDTVSRMFTTGPPIDCRAASAIVGGVITRNDDALVRAL